MAIAPKHNRAEIIELLVDHINKKLPKEEAPLVRDFVRRYYLNTSPEDLASRSILDLYNAFLSHWNFVSNRKAGEPKVQVFNPHIETHGWQSTHTVIEIVYDDMPFLIDSISIALNRRNSNIHLILHVGDICFKRDKEGKVEKLIVDDKQRDELPKEVAIYIEIDKQSDKTILNEIVEELKEVLTGVRTVVQDWRQMKDNALESIKNLEQTNAKVEEVELRESIAFIKWLAEDHFTFLGYQEYDLVEKEGEIYYQLIEKSRLGASKNIDQDQEFSLSSLQEEARELYLAKQLLLVGKTNIRSSVHRPAYMDFVSIKIFDKKGNPIKEKRFMGLYTSVTYNSSVKWVPLLRLKVANVLGLAGFPRGSHEEKTLLNILETLPRDDLFGATEHELLELSIGILHLQERQKIRLFVRRGIFSYFMTCLVFVPREKFTSDLAEKMKEILLRGFNGLSVEFNTRFSDSSLARIHFVIRLDPKKELVYEQKVLEEELVEIGRTWQDTLKEALIATHGEEKGLAILRQYKNAFPAGYQETFSARTAVSDIEYFKMLSKENPIQMSLYHPLDESDEIIRFKLFRIGATIPLSDVVPILENMGLRIISERPYKVILGDQEDSIWINDYRMTYRGGEIFDTEVIKDHFQEAFNHVWYKAAENDGFNDLVLGAGLNWRQVMVLRGYFKYLWQTGFSFSQDHVEEALSANPDISSMLIQLFSLRFDPDNVASKSEQDKLVKNIQKSLDDVSNLNEDRILRRYMNTILATVRTNYYQEGPNQQLHKSYFSFKLQSERVPDLPLPHPMFGVFVYSPRLEGIHLRAAKVARGGIRWSDRREDFRTEILGLMKTQQVKNALIVPMGAKGGFVVKNLPQNGSRDQIMDEVIYCYQTLMRGLLDITDNYQGNSIIHPERVVRYDDDDPYLVVAADKGTATFSDVANTLSKYYGFWLGDAFASGGRTGYDHKKMGITARGAWESVKRHFHEIGFDTQKQNFTVVGIGDMSGDVFGNGMLLSEHIKLVAAFNHMHIFLDPSPDAKASFEERKRLFALPRSAWSDYDPKLISKGGGVFPRSAKSISLTPEIKKLLGIKVDKIVPNDLIRVILKAPVDLLWNGGIGTYVKYSKERNADVGDRTNDVLRINGNELRCKVVGEGGNLGFTQLGRVEYARNGGRLNTDAIDNSGGVNCSDSEVNIKILLNDAVHAGDLTEKQRNEILADIQSEVAEHVLKNNRSQTKAISVTISKATGDLEMHSRIIDEMEKGGKLDRAIEFLPDHEEIETRKAAKQGLTRPEVAVLMAYVKIFIKEALLNSDLPEDPFFQFEIEESFPVPLRERFKKYMPNHRLKREIIATQLSNKVVNDMGISFVSRLRDETGSSSPDIIRAYVIAREIFQAELIQDTVDQLHTKVKASVQHSMLHELTRLVRRGARWFLRNRYGKIDLSATIDHFLPSIEQIRQSLLEGLVDYDDEVEQNAKVLVKANVPEELAYRVASMSALFSALDIVEAASLHDLPVDQVTKIYYEIGKRLKLGWFRELIKRHPVSNHWEALARGSFRDDLDRQQRNLAVSIIMGAKDKDNQDPNVLVDEWLSHHKLLVERWRYFISELKNTRTIDFTMFAVALRELLDMSSQQE